MSNIQSYRCDRCEDVILGAALISVRGYAGNYGRIPLPITPQERTFCSVDCFEEWVHKSSFTRPTIPIEVKSYECSSSSCLCHADRPREGTFKDLQRG